MSAARSPSAVLVLVMTLAHVLVSPLFGVWFLFLASRVTMAANSLI